LAYHLYVAHHPLLRSMWKFNRNLIH